MLLLDHEKFWNSTNLIAFFMSIPIVRSLERLPPILPLLMCSDWWQNLNRLAKCSTNPLSQESRMTKCQFQMNFNRANTQLLEWLLLSMHWALIISSPKQVCHHIKIQWIICSINPLRVHTWLRNCNQGAASLIQANPSSRSLPPPLYTHKIHYIYKIRLDIGIRTK